MIKELKEVINLMTENGKYLKEYNNNRRIFKDKLGQNVIEQTYWINDDEIKMKNEEIKVLMIENQKLLQIINKLRGAEHNNGS